VEKIAEIAGFVPVISLERSLLDLGDPVDQLVPVSIDIIDDRIHHNFSGHDRSDSNVTAAGQDRLMARDAAPGIDSAKHHIVVGIELFADSRIDAVTSDHNVCARGVERAAR